MALGRCGPGTKSQGWSLLGGSPPRVPRVLCAFLWVREPCQAGFRAEGILALTSGSLKLTSVTRQL